MDAVIMHVCELNIYPIKSCGQIPVKEMILDDFGPQWDRRWVLVDEQGVFISQRENRKMALIGVVQDEKGGLFVSAPHMNALYIPMHETFSKVMLDTQLTVWDDTTQGIDMGSDASEWFSIVLDQPCRLVFMPENVTRLASSKYVDFEQKVSYADGFPLLLTTLASLNAVNACLKDDFNFSEIEMQRFRPNIVIDGDFEAFAERDWKAIDVAGVRFDIVKPCSRCVIPSIDPVTLASQSPVIRALKKMCDQDDVIVFGQNMVVSQNQNAEFKRISLNDDVKVFCE
jgi:uncharacterized protein YcbX